MEIIKLGDAAEILSGLVINRFSSSDNHDREYKLVTLRSVEDNIIDEKSFEKVHINREIDDRYLLKKNDILFKLYPPYNIAEVRFEPKDTLIPSNFAIIRMKGNVALHSRYITYLMNGRKFKMELKKNTEGSNVAVIKLNSLKELEFELKPTTEQLRYLQFLDLLLRKEQLQKKYMELHKLYMEAVLENI